MSVKRDWQPYEQYKFWARRMGFRNYKQLMRYTTTHILPEGFPVSPRHTYKDEYEGDSIFFGEKVPLIMPYKDAIRIVHRLQFKNLKEYRKYVRETQSSKPHMRLPMHPNRAWPDEWVDWGTYLGNGQVSNRKRNFLPYKEAMAFVHQLKLKGEKEWKLYAKSDNRPDFIPHNPWESYKDEFTGMRSWLGTDLLQQVTTRVEGYGVVGILQCGLNQPNVFSYNTFPGGTAQALLYCRQHNLKTVRLYRLEVDLMPRFMEVIRQNSSSFENMEFVAINIHEILFNLDMELIIVRPG